MTFTEKNVDHAIEINEYGQPYINPYFGCTAGCPFCYWLSIPGWEGNIDIRLNIAKCLDEYCCSCQVRKPRLYMGSYCDPYMDEVESTYQLTRECLEVITSHGFPLTLCTSARSELILRDLELFKKMEGLTIVTELCRLDQMKRLEHGQDHIGIRMANALHKNGVRVFATFAPIMPGITDLTIIRQNLDKKIPIYIDTMYVEKGSIQARRILDCVKALQPDLLSTYRDYISGNKREIDSQTLAMAGMDNIRLFPIEE